MNTFIELQDLRSEVIQDYYKPSLYLAFPKCTFKCCIEQGIPVSVCHNSDLIKQKTKLYKTSDIIKAYTDNIITKAIIMAGLEPMESFDSVIELVKEFRKITNDDIVIYTGFYPDEINDRVEQLRQFPNIIMKFGRFIFNSKPVYDDVLKINLASENQFAERL